MDRDVRRKAEMAAHVRDFSREHPSPDPNYALVLGQLEATVGRMESLMEQQVGGFLARHSSVLRRQEVRRRLHGGMLRHLVTIAESAADEKPELLEKFQLPSTNVSNKLFRTVARQMLEQGRTERELLVKHGLSEKLLDDLSAGLDEFDASVAEAAAGKRDHVLARAELDELAGEVMRLVGMLDGINRYRFQRDPQLLRAWKSAKHVVSGPQVEATEPTPPTPPPTGEEKPAA